MSKNFIYKYNLPFWGFHKKSSKISLNIFNFTQKLCQLIISKIEIFPFFKGCVAELRGRLGHPIRHPGLLLVTRDGRPGGSRGTTLWSGMASVERARARRPADSRLRRRESHAKAKLFIYLFFLELTEKKFFVFFECLRFFKKKLSTRRIFF